MKPKVIPIDKVCSICYGEIKHSKIPNYFGNNAYPINNGRCCDKCNDKFVIPARMMLIANQLTNEQVSQIQNGNLEVA